MKLSRLRARGVVAVAATLGTALVLTACSAAVTHRASAPLEDQADAVTATTGDGSVVGLAPAAAKPVASQPRKQAARSKRPNILMIMTDDMRVDDLRFMPSVRNLIKARGLDFKNSFSPYPLCCPARASFLTGMYAHNHHVMSHEDPFGFGAFNDSRTLATALDRAGYKTGFVGKYLNMYGIQPSLRTGGPSLRYVPPGWDDWHGAVQTTFRPRHRFSGGTYAYFKTPFNVNGKLEAHKGEYQTNVIGEKTRHLIKKYSRTKSPFFIWLSSVAPHQGASREKGDPGKVRRDDGKLEGFKTADRPRWVRGWFNHIINRSPGMPKGGGPSEADVSDKPQYISRMPEPNAAERRALVNVTRQRAESLYVLDRQIRKTITKLKQTGEYRNTVLMFTSDNGYYLGEHRVRTGKVKPHEPSLRVPFLVAGPGIAQGKKRFDPITTMDVTATIADLANARRFMPFAADGSSKVRTINRGDRGWAAPVVTEALMKGLKTDNARLGEEFEFARDTIGIRTARYKYVRYITDETELYDLNLDPDENHSVHDDPAYAVVKRQLDRVWHKYKDCKGAACTKPLPANLQNGPAALRRQTMAQAAIHDAVYGW